MPSSKKNKKDAKDSGGVVAAIKAASKFSNQSPASYASSTSDSPDLNPVVTAPEENAIPSVSPVVGALSDAISASTAGSTAHDWTSRGLAGSPGNLISPMGESPPTEPSSYEDPSRLHHGWAAQRQFMGPPASSPSPPNSVRRPLSFQMEPHFQAPDTHTQPSTAAYRRSSIASPFSHARIGSHPPLPHQPQAHFYGTPDIDFDLSPQSGMKAGERGYFFGFDTYPSPHAEHTPGSDNVVVAGYEGGLEVYAVNKRGLEHVAGLKGLQGGVCNAKILPWTTLSDKTDSGPLVVVVINGPVLPQGSPDDGALQVVNDTTSVGRTSVPGSPRAEGGRRDGKRTPGIEYYRTTVEVFSLKTNKPVAVLLQAPQAPISTPIASPRFKAPQPSGAFTVKADAGTIVVASGITGECWIYRQFLSNQDGGVQFGCVGKIWTSIQQRLRTDVVEEGDRARSFTTPARPNPQVPILALNGRWIAYCPPTPSSQIALRAHVPVPILGKAPLLSSVTAPQLPSVTSSVDLPISESMVNKIMRETTQELIQGAKWVGQQGVQAWNAYWHKPSVQQPQQVRSPPLAPQQWAGPYPPRHETAQFPPTHGTPGQAVTREPGLVSIIDIETLGNSSALHPLTTFTAPLGCSFLSFSPTGLSLFTASSKGDVQTVWDLMRIQYTKSSPLQVSGPGNNSQGPRVRQIAQFSRMTVARIVDVAWTKPNGERIAMVTERRTVHLLDLPASAFTWPPPRRRKDMQEAKTGPSETSSSAVSIASSAIGVAFEAARPLITRPRRSSANATGQTSTGIVDSASHGGRMIAASISNSLGKTGNAINQLRHTGENRVSLPPGNMLPSPSCVIWITGRRCHTLFVIGDGIVRTFPSKSRQSSSQPEKIRTLRGNRYKDFNLPGLPDNHMAPAVRHCIDADEYLDLSDRDLDAGNTITPDPRPRQVQADDLSEEASIAQAEIESSAPYQPFHTDRRVSLFEYSSKPVTTSPLPSVSVLLADTTLEDVAPRKGKKKRQLQAATESTIGGAPRPWAFGQEIQAVKLDLGLPPVAEEDFNPSDDHRALPASAMERILQVGENDEQIVVTTRRRRGARHTDQDEDGFFEDDCEVLDFADQRV